MITELFKNNVQLLTRTIPIKKPLYYVIFDIGGGTSDLTVAEIKQCPKKINNTPNNSINNTTNTNKVITTIQIIATTGDNKLGGADMTNALTELAISKFKKEYPTHKKSFKQDYTDIWNKCEKKNIIPTN